jgi:Tfp pilus assembly protein PilF
MDSPKNILRKVSTLLDSARERIAAEEWDAAQAELEAALKLDEHNAAIYDAMADLFEAKGGAGKSAQWREKAQLQRKQAWQRQVEAEARGHHDLLGEPGRHEIP